MFDNKMMDNIMQAYKDLSSTEFVEEYNRIFGTTLTVDDITWGYNYTKENNNE